MSDKDQPQLGPGVHAPPDGPYSHVFGGRPVHVDPAHSSDMLAGGLRTWDDPLVAAVLASARGNPSIDDEQRALLPWALTTVGALGPDSLGLVGQASYSGPGATGLVRNLAHSKRGGAFAAELITAAALSYRAWPATTARVAIGDLDETGARIDFGVKLLGPTTGRRTIEADILITLPDGRRQAVDVKSSRAGVSRAVPTTAMLAVIEAALGRGEIESFHFVTRGRFRPAVHSALAANRRVHLHEALWPSESDRRSIALQQLAAVDYSLLVRACTTNERVDFDRLAAGLADEATAAYRCATPGHREIVEIGRSPGLSYLFDKTEAAAPDDTWPRVIANWGRSAGPAKPRDRAFMSGFPLPRSQTPLDRGHLIAREAGGDEGIGINLIPQDRRLNQGRSRQGKRWRALERLIASNPGSGVFVRALYGDNSDHPVRLDYVVALPDGSVVVDRFRNRVGAP